MVTRGGHMMEHRQRRGRTDEKADVAPRFTVVEPVERVAARHARLAAGATFQIDFECKLLTGTGWARREQCRVISALKRLDLVLVKLRESLDGAQVALLGQERVDQKAAPPG